MKTNSIAKLLTIILSITTVFFLLAGCGSGSSQAEAAGPTPTETADTFLQAVKAQDSEKLSEVYAPGNIDLLDSTSAVGEEEASIEGEETTEIGMTEVLEKEMNPMLLDFDYELSNEAVDGDTATVDVKVTTYQLGEAFSEYFSEYLSQSLDMVMDDVSSDELSQLSANILSEKLTGLTEKTYEGSCTLTLTKTDDKWVVDEIAPASDTIDVLSGGLVTAINNMDDAFAAWDE